MKPWWTLERILRVLIVGIALATTGSFFGDQAWWLDILADLKMHIALGGIVLFAVASVCRRIMEAFLALALVVLNAATLAPYILAQSEGLIETSQEVGNAGVLTGAPIKAMKIVMLNVNEHNTDTPQTLGFLCRESADVVVLTEFTDTLHDALKQLSDLYPHRYFGPHFQIAGHDPLMIGVLSKRAWEDKGVVLSYFTLRAIIVWVRFPEASPSLTVAGVHLMNTLFFPANQQEAEAKALTSLVNRFDGLVVVAGDLNMTPLSARFETLLRKTRLRRAGGGLNTTWPSFLTPLGLSLDHLLVGKGIGSAIMRTGPRLDSDHRPIVGTFDLGK